MRDNYPECPICKMPPVFCDCLPASVTNTKRNSIKINDKVKLFLSGFVQVLLVTLNTYFIATSKIVCAVLTGFGISFIWSFNVKKIAFGNMADRITYAGGAAAGSLTALLISKFLLG